MYLIGAAWVGGLVRAIVPSLWLALAASAASAQGSNSQLAQNLRKLSIEAVTQLDITTASRRVELCGERDRERSALAGYQRHLAKPVDPLELVDIIADMRRTEVQPRGGSIQSASGARTNSRARPASSRVR